MGQIELHDFLNTHTISSFFFQIFIVCQIAHSTLQKKSSAAQLPNIASFGFHSRSSILKNSPFSSSNLDTFANPSPTPSIVAEAEDISLDETIFH